MLIQQTENNLIFDEIWLKKNDLVMGRTYIAKDGRLLFYLGNDLEDEYLFIRLMKISVSDGYDVSQHKHISTIYSHDVFGKYIIQACKDLISSSSLCEDNIINLKVIPNLYCEYPWVKMEPDEYKKWYTKRNIVSPWFSKLININFETKKVRRQPIKQELGKVYLTTGGESYLYLGRRTGGYYLYHYVGSGNLDYFNSKPLQYIKYGVDELKSKKRVTGIDDRARAIDKQTLIKLGYYE